VEHARERDSKDLAEIAAQSAWTRRLAIALARDVQAGEDLAQEALMASLRHKPSGNPRSWLARVLRNLARLRRRSEGRRDAREREAARSESPDDPALVLQRIELQEELLGAVRALPEPYRNTILLRWFEELEPEEIARRTDTPVRTVHTRLHRALALLREELDRRSRGDRSRWLAAWLPLAKSPPAIFTWGFLMILKVTIAITCLLCAALLAIRLASGPEGDSAPQVAQASPSAHEPVEVEIPKPTQLEEVVPDAGRREPPGIVGGSPKESGASGGRLHGQVLDTSGAKVSGVELAFHASGSPSREDMSRATSDAFGRFELSIGGERGEIALISKEWSLVYAPELASLNPEDNYVVVLGKPHGISGIVVDPSGKPVPDVEVLALDAWIWNENHAALQEVPLGKGKHDQNLFGGHPSTTDAGGHFHLTALPAHSYRLLAKNKRTLESSISTPVPTGSSDAFLVLGDASGLCSFAGRIVDLQGVPMPHTRISAMRKVPRGVSGDAIRLDDGGTRSDDRGCFEMQDKSCQLQGFIVWPEGAEPPRIVLIDPNTQRNALLIRVGRVALVQVQLETPELAADTAEFLDSAGTVCPTGVKWNDGWSGGDTMWLGNRESAVQMVSEEATMVVLRLRGKEVRRMAIHLDPGRTNVVRP
jgi:RNA polymerase sigma-70 factor (ECF subfamily)